MDRSHAPQSSEADDDIIDLTDIVEQGSVPAASGDAGSGENPLESQMADLLSGTGKVPSAEEDTFDLDALLRASGLNEDGEAAAPEQPSASAPSESSELAGGTPADEEMDMPDMGEVDALLRDLVAPDQPGAPSADTSSTNPETAPEEAPDGGFEALFQETVVAEEVVASPTSPASAEPEVDVDDLDSLLDSIMNPETSAKPAAEPVPPVQTDEASAGGARADDDADLADLDALLAAAPIDGAPENASAAPQMPVEAASEPATPLAEISPPPPASAPEAAAEQQPEREDISAAGEAAAETDDVDLDALLRAARAEMGDEALAPPEAPLPGSDSDAGEGRNGQDEEDGEDPLSGMDALFAAAVTDQAPGGADAPLESDLGDPLLVGESEHADLDLGAAVLSSLDALAADIAAMQEKINAVAEGGGGPDAGAFDTLRERVDDLAAEARELAERHAHGLAVAEARISALEAELAARAAREEVPLALPPEGSAFRADLAALIHAVVARELQEGEHVPPYARSLSEDIARVEERLDAVETAGEKAAAEAAARVIREEIAALVAEMGTEG